MSKITFNQFNILAIEQLRNILKNIIDQSYERMNNDSKLINLFNKKYKINRKLEEINKEEIISILLLFGATQS